jgi:hypothetical protein
MVCPGKDRSYSDFRKRSVTNSARSLMTWDSCAGVRQLLRAAQRQQWPWGLPWNQNGTQASIGKWLALRLEDGDSNDLRNASNTSQFYVVGSIIQTQDQHSSTVMSPPEWRSEPSWTGAFTPCAWFTCLSCSIRMILGYTPKSYSNTL